MIVVVGKDVREGTNLEELGLEKISVEEFKTIAFNSVNWIVGQKIKSDLGTQVQLSTSNSKGIVLLAKLIETLNPDLSVLSALEKESFSKMISLSEKGYSDSSLLNNSLTKVDEYVSKSSEKIVSINEASTIEEIIDILNSKF